MLRYTHRREGEVRRELDRICAEAEMELLHGLGGSPPMAIH